MLPLALAFYEFFLGGKEDLEALIPFSPYRFRSACKALCSTTIPTTTTHSASPPRVLNLSQLLSRLRFPHPLRRARLIALALVIRDRRLWFGAAMLFLFSSPAFLPGRLFPAYCYLLWPDSPSGGDRRAIRVSRLW